MHLSRVERWILYNQYEILAKVDPDNKSTYQQALTVLEHGYELHYGDLCPVYADEDTMSEEDCRLVVDILNLHRELAFSYERLSVEEKKRIDPKDIEFWGFDGNEEAKQLLYAEFFCYDLGRFKELHKPGRDLNSHAPTLERYNAMLRERDQIGRRDTLSADDIIRIVEAGKHYWE